jgi:Transposase, Mutator family
MATPRMDITSFVGKLLEQDDVDALREGVRVLAQAVMETEVSGQIGAAPYERSTERTCLPQRLPHPPVGHQVGTIELKIPKVAAGAYFPSLLEPRRRAEKASSICTCTGSTSRTSGGLTLSGLETSFYRQDRELSFQVPGPSRMSSPIRWAP